MTEKLDYSNKPLERKAELHMGLPNGAILTLIGLLVLMTTLIRPLQKGEVVMNVVAGSVLVIGGVASFVIGLKYTRKR